MRILIVYGTSEGQTRKIATFLAERFMTAGHEVRLVDSAKPPRHLVPAVHDAILIAARVHAGKYPRAILRFVRENRDLLATTPSAFVSVTMFAAIDTDAARANIAGYAEQFTRVTGWRPALLHQAAGARFYQRHSAPVRWLLKRIDERSWGRPLNTSRDQEYTDWQALADFGDSFLASATRGA